MEKDLRDKLNNGVFGVTDPSVRIRMQQNKSAGNKSTEWRLRSALMRSGFKDWIMQPSYIEGKPDFYFPKEELVIFVDGCFWHGCRKCAHKIKKNSTYWEYKIEKNKKRDIKINILLRSQGKKVIRFWEHSLKNSLYDCLNVICHNLLNSNIDYDQ